MTSNGLPVKENAVLLELDISAAFDAVDHFMLCRRAECDFGIRGTALRWLQSFVSDRSQHIAIGLKQSATTALSSGVSQGSILGPLLFAMYMSPTDDVVRAHQMQNHQYANDLMLYTALMLSMFSDLTSVADCTDAVSTWFMNNALLLNPGKTEAVILGTRQRLAGLQCSAGAFVSSLVTSRAVTGCNVDSALDTRPRMTGGVAVAVDWRSLLTFVVKCVARSLAVWSC